MAAQEVTMRNVRRVQVF